MVAGAPNHIRVVAPRDFSSGDVQRIAGSALAQHAAWRDQGHKQLSTLVMPVQHEQALLTWLIREGAHEGEMGTALSELCGALGARAWPVQSAAGVLDLLRLHGVAFLAAATLREAHPGATGAASPGVLVVKVDEQEHRVAAGEVLGQLRQGVPWRLVAAQVAEAVVEARAEAAGPGEVDASTARVTSDQEPSQPVRDMEASQ